MRFSDSPEQAADTVHLRSTPFSTTRRKSLNDPRLPPLRPLLLVSPRSPWCCVDVMHLLRQALGRGLHRGPHVPPATGVGDGGLGQLLGRAVGVGQREMGRMDIPCEYF